MHNKLYSSIKVFFNENIKVIILVLFLYLVLNIPMPYYIHTPGGLIDIADKFTIDGEYEQSGSLNFTYVSEIKGNLLTYIISYFFINWDLIKSEEVKSDNETYEEARFRNTMFLEEANQNAVFLAYEKAGKYINIKDSKHYIVYIDEITNTNLKIRDQLLSVNNEYINSVAEYSDIVRASEVGDKLHLKVKTSAGEEKDKYIEVIQYEGLKITGIYFVTKHDYITNPNIAIDFKESESGPSGGFMMALSIYNKLTAEDITNNKKIVGTGTIDLYGNVGEVSGIEYKLKGAVKNKAEIFLIPSGINYQKAIDLKEKNEYNIEIISIKTLDDAINYLHMIN